MTGHRRNLADESSGDESFDQLCRELLSVNLSRYQLQTQELLRKGRLEGELNGYKFAYILAKNECTFTIALPPKLEMQQQATTHLHWRKSKKLEYIPLFFAQCEAAILVD
jgi:hypothetical protein